MRGNTKYNLVIDTNKVFKHYHQKTLNPFINNLGFENSPQGNESLAINNTPIQKFVDSSEQPIVSEMYKRLEQKSKLEVDLAKKSAQRELLSNIKSVNKPGRKDVRVKFQDDSTTEISLTTGHAKSYHKKLHQSALRKYSDERNVQAETIDLSEIIKNIKSKREESYSSNNELEIENATAVLTKCNLYNKEYVPQNSNVVWPINKPLCRTENFSFCEKSCTNCVRLLSFMEDIKRRLIEALSSIDCERRNIQEKGCCLDHAAEKTVPGIKMLEGYQNDYRVSKVLHGELKATSERPEIIQRIRTISASPSRKSRKL